jgi:hypothetical protein
MNGLTNFKLPVAYSSAMMRGRLLNVPLALTNRASAGVFTD